ncbi:hypothetical protein ACKVWC_009246 [Pyricularia oryzae]|nr:hypothetical protein MCOR32_000102 [Pyricularia oryzae]KAI6471722.1 hypothetical protein MCOR15_000856 [Pyricularia oryzae]KAI6534710.1 hypothetical protein MCOR16_003033 [Pyricularia oryzae]KAI6556536.1 hypothetical protein MCOR03_006264 [Pyricularia oryzae]
MKSSAVLPVLAALGAAWQHEANPEAARLMHLVVRQETIIATTTSTPTGAVVTQAPALSCISSYIDHLASVASAAATGMPTLPAPVESFYEELHRTATTDYVCAVARASVPPAIVSQEAAYYSSVAEHLDGSVWASPPPQCGDLWTRVLTEVLETISSLASSCSSGATATGASATHATNATSAGGATSTAAIPAPTAAAGRSGVSASLAIGAAAVFGYFELA